MWLQSNVKAAKHSPTGLPLEEIGILTRHQKEKILMTLGQQPSVSGHVDCASNRVTKFVYIKHQLADVHGNLATRMIDCHVLRQ